MSAAPGIGDQFGAYRITGELGRGGMGVVLLATQVGLERPVALKILDPTLALDPEFLARFHHEATVLARLDSPHVVQVHDHGQIGGNVYLAMQYVPGGDLAHLLGTRGALAPAEALGVFSDVCIALEDAHGQGIVHRDVKPSNVLLRRPGDTSFAYLCDFGIAQSGDVQLTRSGSVAGTWAYLAPERAEGRAATVQSDLYSAGCLLWAMLTGRNPYQGTDVQVALAHGREPIPVLPGNDPFTNELNRLLHACLAKDPSQRPASAASAGAAARRLAQGLGHGVGTVLPAVAAGPVTPPPLSDATNLRPTADPTNLRPTADPTILRPTADWTTPRPAPAPIPVPPGGTAFTPAPQAPPRRRWLPWAVAAALTVMVAGTAVVLLNTRGTAGEAAVQRPAGVRSSTAAATTPASPAGSANPAGSASPASTAPVSGFLCWDGRQAGSLDDCGSPNGMAGLRYLYPSLVTASQDKGVCKYVSYRPTTDTMDCTFGRVVLRYRYWDHPREAAKHYRQEYRGQTSRPFVLDGTEVGTIYRSRGRLKGSYRLSASWFGGHYSTSVEGANKAQREKWLQKVRIRALADLNGHPAGQEARVGVVAG